MTKNQIIATTIINQLGGNKFKVMTGAKDLLAIDNGVSFKLPSRFAKDGINHISITLNGNDLYDIKFNKITSKNHEVYNIRVPVLKEFKSFDDVYAEDLTELFESTTGLFTKLF